MITVIVPVYNVEDYLHYAMESLVKQTYKNFEVILVDDGSSDSSGQLCDQYAGAYDWVSTYHKENGGLSDARNFGVSKAKGEWVTFLDPDDYLEPIALELMKKLQEKTQADIISAKAQSTSQHHAYHNYQLNETIMNQVQTVRKEEALIEMLYGELTTVSACAKLYCKEILLNNPFPLGRIYEDLYAVSDHLNKARMVALIDVPIYHYYYRIGSITSSAFTPKQYEFFEAINHLKEVVKMSYSPSFDIQAAIISRFFTGSLHIFTLIQDRDPVEFKKLQKRMEPYLSLVLKNSRVSKKRKILYTLITRCPNVYFYFKKWKRI